MPSIADSRKKRGRGRPRTGIGRAIGLRLYPELESQISDWIEAQFAPMSQPEAIRTLIELGLAYGLPTQPAAEKTETRKRRKA